MRSAADLLNPPRVQGLLRELGEAARVHRFGVAPNPCVGAAVLAGTREVGRGFHRVWGEEHAEVAALEAARASGVPSEAWDTLIVTLEPCSTEAKTGPCVERILEAGIRQVFVGALDPDSRHRGRGLELLRRSGVQVHEVAGAAPLETVSPHFLRWTSRDRIRRPRPWTIAKWAQTLTGQLSPPAEVGAGRWISSAESRAEVQVLRSRVDAIVTGVGTVLADDPRLTVRAPGATQRPPWRVVLDAYLRTPRDARLFAPPAEGESAGEVHVLALVGADSRRRRELEESGAKVHGLRGSTKLQLDLRTVQTWLWEQGAQRMLVEAGPELLRAYLSSGFVDHVRVVSGDVRGGRGESLGDWLASAKLLERHDRECGADAVLEAFLAEG